MRKQLLHTTIELLPDKALFIPDRRALIIADAHFTKETHFRKHGIAVPAGMIEHDLERLNRLCAHLQVQQIIFLGDMFHSEHNRSMDQFIAWRHQQKPEIHLVAGNHDILGSSWYDTAGIIWHREQLQMGDLVLSHDRIDVAEGKYNLHGHIHPCIRLTGKARQSLRLPCFWFGKQHGVLPSFGSFTGGHTIQPGTEDSVYAVAGDQIMEIPRVLERE